MAVENASAEHGFSVSVDNGIAHLTLERPQKLNAVTAAMWQALTTSLEELGADEQVRVVIISGDGGNFCAGADIAEFETVRRDAHTARNYEALNAASFSAIRNCAKPTIAMISGVCFGGGFGLAASCDLRIAAPDARFAVPAAKLGLGYPVEAMADIVASTGAQMARYLTFSGARIDARRALECGFLLEIVDMDSLVPRAREIANSLAQAAPLSIRASKASIAAALSGRPEDTIRAQELGDITFESQDYAEGRAAFRERRPARFIGK